MAAVGAIAAAIVVQVVTPAALDVLIDVCIAAYAAYVGRLHG